jgi:hypothetical protein
MDNANGTHAHALAPRTHAAVTRPVDAALPADMDVFRLGAALAASGFFPGVNDEAKAVAKILAGRELGFGPVASLTNIHIIEGKPTMGANLIAAAIKGSRRYDFRVRRMDDTGCALEFYQNGEPVGVSEFTKADAHAAGLLSKGNWTKFPRNMYFARALTNGARWYCADVFVTGAYTPEELNPDLDVTADGEPLLPSNYRAATTDATHGDDLANRLAPPPQSAPQHRVEDYGRAVETAASAPASDMPAATAANIGDWRSFELTFGKHKGKTLGEVDDGYLRFLRGREVKLRNDGTMWPSDAALNAALAAREAERNGSSEGATIDGEREIDDDGMPF